MNISIIEIQINSEDDVLKLNLQNVDNSNLSNEEYLISRKHIKDLRNLLLSSEEFTSSGKFIVIEKKELGELLRIIRNRLFYGRRQKLINFTSIWINDTNLRVKIMDPLTEKEFEDFIISMIQN